MLIQVESIRRVKKEWQPVCRVLFPATRDTSLFLLVTQLKAQGRVERGLATLHRIADECVCVHWCVKYVSVCMCVCVKKTVVG